MYACLVIGETEIFSSQTIPTDCSCDEIDTPLYTFATTNQNNTVAIGPEFDEVTDIIQTIGYMSGNDFTTISECVTWGLNNNVLIFFNYEQLTN